MTNHKLRNFFFRFDKYHGYITILPQEWNLRRLKMQSLNLRYESVSASDKNSLFVSHFIDHAQLK